GYSSGSTRATPWRGGVSAMLVPPPPDLFGPLVPDQHGFLRYECSNPTGDAALRIAHIPVAIDVAPGTSPLSTTLTAEIKIKPTDSKPTGDDTTADLVLTVSAAA